MSLKTKSILIVFAAELGASCLLVAGIVAWEVRRNALKVVSAQPIAAVSPAFQPSATPFLPSLAETTVSPSQTFVAETVSASPSEANNFPLPQLPSLTPQTASTPGSGIPLITKGPLTATQQLLLEVVSRQYVAPTTADGIRLARELNYIGIDGHPSNICGPLSIAILREVGIISPETPLDKFWLLDPKQSTARQLLARTFPAERFEDLRTHTPLNKFDWNASPLQPGDFLYIYAGSGGNFEHMLVVNRVDSKQRAYAVTNYATPEGFVILEVLLYDPNDQELGIFHTWTKQNYALLGSTGFGGFEIWRLRSP